MTHPDLITRLKAFPSITDETTVGVVSSFGKGAEVNTKSDTRGISVIANTDDIDLDREVVVPSGADTTYFERNKMIFADHKYDIDQTAGKLRRLDKYPSDSDHKSWRVFSHINRNPIGDAVMAIVKETGQIGVSVGFKVLSAGPPTSEEESLYSKNGVVPRSIVRLWEWFELSFTALPCNVACQSMELVEGKSLDMLNSVDRLVTKGMIDRESASLLGMPISPKRKFHAVNTPKSRMVFGEGGIVMVKRL